jgi:hypothetical protein
LQPAARDAAGANALSAIAAAIARRVVRHAPNVVAVIAISCRQRKWGSLS